MAGHGPAVKLGKDNASPYKQSLGIKLFIFYALVYAGFVVINTLSPKTMEAEVFLGQNLAVVYGMGLIILAIIMGLVYNHMCTKKEVELNSDEPAPEAKADVAAKETASDDAEADTAESGESAADSDSETGEDK